MRARILLLQIALLLSPCVSWAQSAEVPGAGHGTTYLAWQNLYIGYHVDSQGHRARPGTIRGLTAQFGVDYGLTDRLALNVEIPYKSNVYYGMPHKHIEDNHDEQFIDDGQYHSGWGDGSIGLRYRWISEAWELTPFVTWGQPLRDYPTYAHAAVGTGQSRLTLGVAATAPLPFRNWYFVGNAGYTIAQKVDRRRVNHALVNLGANWLAAPGLTAHAQVTFRKSFNGLDFPDDYPPGVDEETFYHHDQNLRDDYINVGGGLSYEVGSRYSVFAEVGRTVWGENTHLINYVVTVGLARSF